MIFLVILFVVLVVTGVIKAPGLYNPDRSSNYNRNSNYNSNLNTNLANDNSNSNSSNSSSTMSDDDKHRLLLAASLAQDSELMQRVIRKLGFITASGGVSDDYAEFIREHAVWAIRNREFIQSVNTPELARAYINAHIDD